MLSFLKLPVVPTTRLAVRCVTTSSHSKQQAATRPQQAKPFNSIPGPKPLPLLGNLLEISKVRKSGEPLWEFYDREFKKYGEIMKITFPGVGPMVIVADPDALEEVLRAEGKYPQRDKLFSPKMKWFSDQHGIPATLSNEGEDWKQQRVAVSKQVLPRNVNSYIEGLNPIYTRFSDHLRKIRSEDGLIEDFTPLSRKLTMEATGKFVFDADLDLLVNPKEEDLKFLDKVNQFFEAIGRLAYELPLYKIYKNNLYHFYSDALHVSTIIMSQRNYLEPIHPHKIPNPSVNIQTFQGCLSHGGKYANRLQEKLEKGESSEVQGMLEQWLREKKITTEEAVVMSSVMLIAGVHTTAYQSVFLLFELAKNPEVQEQLYQEIQSVVGERPPTAQDLEAMPYLRGCIKESFRVRTVNNLLTRVLKKDAVIHGYHVPAGVTLFYSIYTAARHEQIFDEPSKFKPERWMRKDGPQQHRKDGPQHSSTERMDHSSRTKSPFSLLPFGFGPRQCYGKRFAVLEIKLLLVELARNFTLKTTKDDLKMIDNVSVTVDEDVPLYFTDRK